jgi:chorismate synthase
MSGSTFGTLFRVTTWGESHGPATGAVIDGCPPHISLSSDDIQQELDRRKPGGLPSATPRREKDTVQILSGVFEGKTTGTPISLMIENRDADSAAYEKLRNLYRPGHGDFTYQARYGIRDYRGGGRASARETAGRVAAGAVARRIAVLAGIDVFAFTRELGGISISTPMPVVRPGGPLYCPDADAEKKMVARLDEAKKAGDTLGGIVEIVVRGCPAGLGEPVFSKLDGDLAGALMGIGSVKGVEIGAGFASARMTGSICNDQMGAGGFLTNNAGGILAGIANGNEIIMRVACKPIPSISLSQQTVDSDGNPVTVQIGGRHDVAVIPRIIPVCEAMVCMALADHLLRLRAITKVKHDGN